MKINNKRKFSNIKRKIAKAILGLFVIIFAVSVGYELYIYSILDNSKLFNNHSVVYDKQEKVIGILGGNNYVHKKFSEIPEDTKNAFIATEDSRFYSHKGVDIPRLISAIAGHALHISKSGASTITQQVARNTYLTIDQNLARKMNEVFYSLAIENKNSKDTILESYINLVGLGGRNFGVEAASQAYFKKTISKLTLPEEAILAGLPQAPTYYNPLVNPAKAIERRNVVANLMSRHGYIDKFEENAIKHAKLFPKNDQNIISDVEKSKKVNLNKYQHYLDYVERELKKNYGIKDATHGLKIYTNMDSKIQEKIYDVAHGDVKLPKEPWDFGFAITTKNNEISGLFSGRKFFYGGFSFATSIKRQPGSSIKPFMPYGPAIEKYHWSTAHKIEDTPVKYSGDKGFTIHNEGDDSYLGVISLKDAIGLSRNPPAVRTVQQLNIFKNYDDVTKIARDVNLQIPKHEASALGAFDGVNPLQMASAYSMYANGGVFNEPRSIKYIITSNNQKVEKKPTSKRVVSSGTAFLISQMMHRSTLSGGTAATANAGGAWWAAKTGTSTIDPELTKKLGIPSYTMQDMWLDGFTSEYAFSLWGAFPIFSKQNHLTKDFYPYLRSIVTSILSSAKNGKEREPSMPDSITKIGDDWFWNDNKEDNLKDFHETGAKFDPASNSIVVTWNGKSNPNKPFSVKVFVDGTLTETTSTSDETYAYKVSTPSKLTSYAFEVVDSTGSTIANSKIDLMPATQAPAQQPPPSTNVPGNQPPKT